MHEINDELLWKVVNTLKMLDVRGFDSMNMLVGLVNVFESILESPPVDAEKEAG